MSVIGHGIGGILIPAKWRNLIKACCWSKQWQKLVTWSYNHSNRMMALRSKYVYTPRSMGNSYAEYPYLTDWSSIDTMQESVCTYGNLDRILIRSNHQSLAYVDSRTSAATQNWWIFHTSNRFLNHMGSCRIRHDGHMFCITHVGQNHLKLIIIFSFDTDKPRGALPGLWWYVQISTGNKFWGLLTQKKGGTTRGLRTYHRQQNKSSASHMNW